MKLFIASVMLAASSLAQAASVPTNLEFPIKNGEPGAVYRMTDHPNAVYVFEVFSLSCSYCNTNAPAVDRLAKDFAGNARVQVLDVGLDTSDNNYREWIRRHAPNHVVVADPARKVYNPLRTAEGIPQAFVVNCKGERVGSQVGSWDAGAERKLRALVNTALETTCE